MAGKFIFDARPLEKAFDDNLISGVNRRKIANSIAAALKGALAEAIGKAVADAAAEEREDIMGWRNQIAKKQHNMRCLRDHGCMDNDEFLRRFMNEDEFRRRVKEGGVHRYMRYFPPDSNIGISFSVADFYEMCQGEREDIPASIESRPVKSAAPDCVLYTSADPCGGGLLEQDFEGSLTLVVPQGGNGDPVRVPLDMNVGDMTSMHRSIRMYADGLRHSESDEWYMQLKRLAVPLAGKLVDKDLLLAVSEKLQDPDAGLSRDFVNGFVSARMTDECMSEESARNLLREMIDNDATFVVIENPKNGRRAIVSPVRAILVNYVHRKDEVAAKALENYAESVSLVTDLPVAEIMRLDPALEQEKFSLMPDAESDSPVIELSVRGVNMRELRKLAMKDAQKDDMSAGKPEEGSGPDRKASPAAPRA